MSAIRATSAPAYDAERASAVEIGRPSLPVSVNAMSTETWLTAMTRFCDACAEMSPRSTKLAPRRFDADSAASGSLRIIASTSACAICRRISSGV